MFKNPKPALLAALRETGPVPGDENGLKKRAAGGDESTKKKKRTEKNVGRALSFLFHRCLYTDLFLLG